MPRSYTVRIVLDDAPLLRNGEMVIDGNNVTEIVSNHSNLSQALAAVSPEYVNDRDQLDHRETLFHAVVAQGQLIKLHCYVPMLDQATYAAAVKAGDLHPQLIEAVIVRDVQPTQNAASSMRD